LFNFIFLVAAGLYIYMLVQHPARWGNQLNWRLMANCFAAVCSVYLVKFLTLKSIGWITGFNAESNLYIFVVFLINKITGILLLPILLVLSFATPVVVSIFTYGSFVMVGILFLLRYFRSYGLLQHRIKVGRFHFLMYVFAIELLPLLLIYKAVHDFVLKNL
jgi:hypothetical protein